MIERDDNALIERVLQGDTGAYRVVVERHQGRIFYLGLKFFHNQEDAEDFAQEVLLRAFEKLETFQGKVPFSAWLYRLAFNLAVNRYHLNRRRLAEVVVEDPPAGNSAHPESKLLEEELKKNVREVLKGLPDAYNLVLKMHYFDGLTYPEISESVGIPVNTVKSHVFRAKKLIRKKLARFVKE